jgi:hypothetical protein
MMWLLRSFVRYALFYAFRRFSMAAIMGGIGLFALSHAHLSPFPGASNAVAAVAGSVLPDRQLTPGAVVTDDVATVCRSGYASSVRPRGAEWADIKAAARSRYEAAGEPVGTVGDHLVPLALGGAPRDLRNVWLQPYSDAHSKDLVEMQLWVLVCDGRMDLRAAQQRIAADWRSAVPSGTTFTSRELALLNHFASDTDY